MKKFLLFFWVMLSIDLAYSQCEIDFSNFSSVYSQSLDYKNLKNCGFIVDSLDTLLINDLSCLSLNKVGCDSGKIGIWPSKAEVILTRLKEPVYGVTISLSKTTTENYLIKPIEFSYYVWSKENFDERPAKVYRVADDLKEINFSFEDGSFFKFLPNEKGEYVFTSSDVGIASKFANFF